MVLCNAGNLPCMFHPRAAGLFNSTAASWWWPRRAVARPVRLGECGVAPSMRGARDAARARSWPDRQRAAARISF